VDFKLCITATLYIYLKFLNEVLEYLEKWEKAVAARQGFQDDEKKNMLLSQETSNGINHQ